MPAGGETQKRAARLFARSFLFTSRCSPNVRHWAILDALALPPTNQVINAAGKFLIVAPNTLEVRTGAGRRSSAFR